ncbi:PAC1 [Symbiodinium sp. CCMP2456]|nr:PAC1 [Symbiodinium sp. CCMP2456]
MAFFKEGFSKIIHAVKGDASQSVPYDGRLSADCFKLHEGMLLGIENLVPRTLAYLPGAGLIGFCTSAGHVKLVSDEHEMTLTNPAAPFQPEFLSFPRAGLILLVGVATSHHNRATAPQSSSSVGPPESASWMAQWWELGGGGLQIPQSAWLRFGVTCTATAEDACLVFLGTDEGDVRVFDAGERPHVGSYCISFASLHNHKKPQSLACPITAVAVVPQSAPELLVATGDGTLVLWSFDKHRVCRTYDCSSPAVSLAWCPSGSHFLAASRRDMSIFCRSSSSVLVRVALPGGISQHASILQWGVGDLSAIPHDKLPKHLGQVLLLRTIPNAALLRLSGESWSQVEPILADVTSAVLCQGRTAAGQLCGCPNGLPAAPTLDSEVDVTGEDSLKQCVLAVRSTQTGASEVSVLGAGATRIWPASWGSLQLSNVSCIQLLPKQVLQLQNAAEASLLETCPTAAQAESSVGEPRVQWAVRDGTLQDLVGTSCGEGFSSTDGWFILTGCDNVSDTGHAVGDTLRWTLPSDVQLVECEASFSLDAKVLITIWDDAGTENTLQLDVQEQLASWGTLQHDVELAPGAEHCLQFQPDDDCAGFSVAVDACSLPWRVQRPQAMLWRCQQGELRIRHMFARISSTDCMEDPTVFSTEAACKQFSPTQLVEMMFAHHVAHFRSFVQGTFLSPNCEAFVGSWALLAGGCQGLLCSGHKDGCIRIWLRSHASVLLLHVLSVQSLASLPWRPRFDPSTGLLEPGPGSQNLGPSYDGVDSCPPFPAGETSGPGVAVTAVSLELAAGAVVAGCSSGEVVLFMWQNEAQRPSPAETAEWKVQSLLLAAQECGTGGSGAQVPEPPELPAGFVCTMRLRQHEACVKQLRIISDGRSFQILSVDATSRFCVVDCSSGQLLFSQSLASLSSEVSQPKVPQPPVETLDAVVTSNCILQVSRSSPAHAAVPAMDVNQLKMDLLAKDAMSNSMQPTPKAYLLAFSSGELRQVAGPPNDLKLLDNRIRETRLPQLAGGSFLGCFLNSKFLLTIQSFGLNIFKREGDKLHSAGQSIKFSTRAMEAGVVDFDGELCLYAILRSGQLDILALPSLHSIVSLPVGACAARALKGQGDATDGDQVGFFSGGSGICSDGYMALHYAGALWIGGASEARECRALEASAKAASSAYLVQKLHGLPAASDAPERGPKPVGILGTLFGRTQKTMRDCLLPAEPLPAEVDGNLLDQGRGLAPAWQSQGRSQSQSAPQTQTTRNAAANVREALAGATANAVERGDKISSLADSSRRLADNADQFLDLAKQLNAKQNRWF